MREFVYKVINGQGERAEGLLEASDLKQAAEILRSKGMVITKLEEEKEDFLSQFWISFNKPKKDEISNFTRQLSTMIGAGLPLVDALKILKEQSKPVMAVVIEKVLKEVEGGSSLAEALRNSGGGFTEVYLSLVKAGESAGVLDNILRKLADALEKQREFRSKTKGALVYPAIVVVGMIVVAVIMMVFVVPRLTTMYKDFGAELPLPTKILMGASEFMVNYWIFLAAAVVGLLIMFQRWTKTEVGQVIVEQLVLKVPIWGKLKKDIILTEFARTMALLANAGISVLDGMRIVADTLGSKVYGDGVKRAAMRVEKGESMAESIKSAEEFPEILSQMIAVGEQTGKVDEILMKLANFYESESETKIKALTSAIEPIIMIFMGIGVGFLVIAVIMPIYNLTSQF
ncbi:type II secretion system F family protein [Candidatus Collierbacteria bacterium]|nr:type II secretion system F family protein [Candidatus Collierbacteria bacterium]